MAGASGTGRPIPPHSSTKPQHASMVGENVRPAIPRPAVIPARTTPLPGDTSGGPKLGASAEAGSASPPVSRTDTKVRRRSSLDLSTPGQRASQRDPAALLTLLKNSTKPRASLKPQALDLDPPASLTPPVVSTPPGSAILSIVTKKSPDALKPRDVQTNGGFKPHAGTVIGGFGAGKGSVPVMPVLARAGSSVGQPTALVLPPMAHGHLSASQPSLSPPVKSPFERRTKIANELLDTEETYFQGLKNLLEIYPQTLLNVAEVSTAGIVHKLGVRNIFESLPQIIGINEELLSQLRKKMAGWNETQTLGDIFLTMAPFLKIYREYENGYEEALTNYTNFMRDPAFAAAVEACDSQPGVAISLENCLITPIQRIPRYKLLLEDLLRHTPPEHRDAALLKQALSEVEKVVSYIDENLKEAEQRQRLIDLTIKSGAGALLVPHRKLLREDDIKRADMGSRTKSHLHILLFNDVIVPCPQSKLLNMGTGNLKQSILNNKAYHWPLDLLWLKEEDAAWGTRPLVEITGPTRTYILKFSSQEEKSSWLRDTKDAIEKQMKASSFENELADKRIGAAHLKNSGHYEGEWLRGMRHGTGMLSIFGNVYKGTFDQNLKSGRGRMVYSTKDLYIGDWSGDLPHGMGIMTYASGSEYNGYWKIGRRSGQGALRYPNGDVYEGNWDDNLPQGFGKLVAASGIVYEGYWLEGQFHGSGQLWLPNGKSYNGAWVSGAREGQGTYKYMRDGFCIEEYTGSWVADAKHGTGMWITVEGMYKGEVTDDKRDGKGLMQYQTGSVYDGMWKKGKRHGFGILTASDMSLSLKRYEGEWVGDKKHGKGTAEYLDGSVYEGYWKQDLAHGNGVMSGPHNDMRVECKWERGMRIGPAKLNFKPTQGNEGYMREVNGTVREPLVITKKATLALPPLLPTLVLPDSYSL